MQWHDNQIMINTLSILCPVENHEHCGGGAGPHDTMKRSLQVLPHQLLSKSHVNKPFNTDKPFIMILKALFLHGG